MRVLFFTPMATPLIPSPGGGAPRSESLIYMIAGGNHTLIHRWHGASRDG